MLDLVNDRPWTEPGPSGVDPIGRMAPTAHERDIMDQTLEATEVSEIPETAPVAETELVEEELLVEEISIDGMCGVY